WNIASGVRADHEEQPCFRKLRLKLPHRIDRVAVPAPIDFQCANAPRIVARGLQASPMACLTFDCQSQHFDAVDGGSLRALALQGLNRGGHEPDFIERSLLLTRARKLKMPVVDRIKATAVDAETHGGGQGSRV